jgi:hypothetical protein
MSPLWDYNLGFGNGDFFRAYDPIGWVADGLGKGDWYEIPFWWDKLRSDPYFNTLLKYRWDELRNREFSNSRIFEFIDSCANLLKDAQQRNFTKFDILDTYVWPNPYVGGTFDNEVNYLKSWIAQRLDWLDSQMELFIPLGVDQERFGSISAENQLFVFPNPYTERVTLRLDIARKAEVKITILDVLGEIIIDQSKACGVGITEFHSSDSEFSRGGNLFIYTLFFDGEPVRSGKLVKY